jgi:hypothetical protein
MLSQMALVVTSARPWLIISPPTTCASGRRARLVLGRRAPAGAGLVLGPGAAVTRAAAPQQAAGAAARQAAAPAPPAAAGPAAHLLDITRHAAQVQQQVDVAPVAWGHLLAGKAGGREGGA